MAFTAAGSAGIASPLGFTYQCSIRPEIVSRIVIEYVLQPGAGVRPVPVGGGAGDVQGRRGLIDRQSGEQVHLCHVPGGRVFSRQTGESIVEGEQEVRVMV